MLRLKYGTTNWPAPNVEVFIAQLVEHCSANAEAMGLNPIESPPGGGGGTPLQEANVDVPLDGVAFSRLAVTIMGSHFQ